MMYARFIIFAIISLLLGAAGLMMQLQSGPMDDGTASDPPIIVTRTVNTSSESSGGVGVINNYYTITGVTEEYLEERLATLPLSTTTTIIQRRSSGGGSSSAIVDDVAPDQLSATDFGPFTCNGTTCTINTEITGMEDLSDVGAMTEAYGDVLMWDGSAWTNTATSSLGISGGGGGAYPFALTGNATSTLTQFNGGLTAFASTTIGDGSALGGLTISGNATTTGTAYIAGSLGIGTTTPGSILSIHGVANFTTATSTLYGSGGINLSAGCFAVNGVCVNAGGGSGLASYDAWTHPAVGQSATTSLMLFNGNASSTQFSAGIAYFGQTGTTTITGAGFVGVGSSTPWAQLSINPTSANGAVPAFAIGSSTATSFIVANSGRVGVGTTSPGALLAIHSSSGNYFHFGAGFQDIYRDNNRLLFDGARGGVAANGGGISSDNGLSLGGALSAQHVVITTGGSVGIGTTSPAAQLGVAGSIYTTGDLILGNGTGKITVGTIDPVYSIAGVNYATYVSGMIGVKEEVTGTAVIETQVTADDGSEGYITVLDFDEEPPGSDLWVFAQATHIRKHIDRLVVLLSAETGAKVWYEVDKAQRKVYLLSDRPTRVSYRMTAPRFDTAEWTNFNLDGITGFKPPSNETGDYFSDIFTLSFGSSTPASLTEGLMAGLRAWFAQATNGIGSLFANAFMAKERICVDGECLTKDDIRALLDLVRDENVPQSGGGSEEPPSEEPPAEEPGDEELPPTEEPEEEVPEEEGEDEEPNAAGEEGESGTGGEGESAGETEGGGEL